MLRRRCAHPTLLALALPLLGLTGCGESSGLDGLVGRLAIRPVFSSAGAAGVAGIVDIARTQIRLAHANGGPALDTVVVVPPGADSVTLVAQVELNSSNESFVLTVAFITPAGDTAFVGGPITVQLGTGAGAPVPVDIPTTYVGVGANALGVRITNRGAFVPAGDSITLAAEAFDSLDQVIPGTPIAWSSLDTALAKVPDPAVGMVVGGFNAGQARIVASLLTGPADTVFAAVGVATGTGNVLVLSNFQSGNLAIMDSFPVYMPGFTFDTMDVSGQTPSLAFLMQYPVILLYEDGLFTNAPNVGDTVAAYVLAGGNLVIGTFYWQDRSDNVQFAGSASSWGALETLDPFFGPFGAEYRADSLAVASIVAHPMTAGLTSLSVDQYHGGVVAKPGTTVLARWSDACDICQPDTQTPLLGFRIEKDGQRIVGVSTAPQYPGYGGFTGDFYRLWANVFGWAILGGPGGAGASRLTGGAPRAHPVMARAAQTRPAPRGGAARR